MSLGWRFVLTLAVEAGWEIVENTNFVINRYREGTIAFDYLGRHGWQLGGRHPELPARFLPRRWIGFWGSLAFIVVTEVVMLFWIRDNLLLNIVMLLHPFEGIKHWQAVREQFQEPAG